MFMIIDNNILWYRSSNRLNTMSPQHLFYFDKTKIVLIFVKNISLLQMFSTKIAQRVQKNVHEFDNRKKCFHIINIKYIYSVIIHMIPRISLFLSYRYAIRIELKAPMVKDMIFHNIYINLNRIKNSNEHI